MADQAKVGGYTLVLNSAFTDVVVYSGPENDLTDAVLKLENVGAPIDVAMPVTPAMPSLLMSTNSTP